MICWLMVERISLRYFQTVQYLDNVNLEISTENTAKERSKSGDGKVV